MWKEAQKQHHLQMNNKSACLWTIAILKKLLMIWWDMWQFRNQVFHSSTCPTAMTSHYLLNYQISKGKCAGIDGIDCSNYHLFSNLYTITKFYSSSIPDKKLWLEIVCLDCAEYEEPSSSIIHQAVSMRNQMQAFLITYGPLLPVPSCKRPIATQDNCISEEEEQAAITQFLEPNYLQQSVLGPLLLWLVLISTDNLQQQTLFKTW